MENNHVVVISFFEDDGAFGFSKREEYGPYSKEEAERMASHLTEVGKQLRGGVFKTFFVGASAIMLEPKGVEEILDAIKGIEAINGPLPTPAEIQKEKERQRLEKLRGPKKPREPRW